MIPQSNIVTIMIKTFCSIYIYHKKKLRGLGLQLTISEFAEKVVIIVLMDQKHEVPFRHISK